MAQYSTRRFHSHSTHCGMSVRPPPSSFPLIPPSFQISSKSVALAPDSFAFTGIKQWNSLPRKIKEIDSIAVFKSKLKEYLFSRYD